MGKPHRSIRKLIMAVSITALCLPLTACDNSARNIWKTVLKDCSKTDLLGKDIIYLGPTNTLGVGTLFRKFDKGGYQLSLKSESYLGTPPRYVHNDAAVECKGTAKTSFSLGTKIKTDDLLSVPSEIGATLGRAKNVEVSVKSYSWQSLELTPYEDFLSNDQSAPGAMARNAVTVKKDRVLTRALRVSGLTAKLMFATSLEPSVKATIPSVISTPSGNGVEIKATWKDDRTLELTAIEDAFIAGELRVFQEGGLSSANLLQVETGVENARVNRSLTSEQATN